MKQEQKNSSPIAQLNDVLVLDVEQLDFVSGAGGADTWGLKADTGIVVSA